ncbi:hypothetical protein PACTADRAFT_51687 [Pachysolen tannophilus NRRL Y-2460]|uniref:Protein kinase domain-containing protein n=1 Tax=Pachysolen tannophilus NRRL Y-2460 TaxID=669874 RepID=A0A1E4TQA8_PACTA|nr:hypothetical protein PACTADRAFT_51687 [Pachysolen tannophilus NRRL Y-2460]
MSGKDAQVPIPLPPDIDNPPKNIPLRPLEKRYCTISSLGSGSFGSVILAKKIDGTDYNDSSGFKNGTMLDPLPGISMNSNKLVAIKTMNKRLPTLNDYNKVKELKFIFSIPSHSCLVQIYEIFVDNSKFQLHIVMEPMSQNLYQLMKVRQHNLFSSVTLKSILAQILAGIRHIHRYSYFHRDVKPENILVIQSAEFYGSKEAVPPERRQDRYVVKLADYGLARHINNTRPYTAYVSTRWYRAPEILLRKKFYSKPVDIWAFGSVAVELANFRPLFPGKDELDQTLRVLEIAGSPNIPSAFDLDDSGSSDSVPLGGYWDEAESLFTKLGLQPQYFSGVHISHIIKVPFLSDIVKRCLIWDPNRRATVDELCQMVYFKNHIALKENNSSISDAQISNNKTMQDWNKKNLIEERSNKAIQQRSLNKLFAGIPQQQQQQQQQQIQPPQQAQAQAQAAAAAALAQPPQHHFHQIPEFAYRGANGIPQNLNQNQQENEIFYNNMQFLQQNQIPANNTIPNTMPTTEVDEDILTNYPQELEEDLEEFDEEEEPLFPENYQSEWNLIGDKINSEKKREWLSMDNATCSIAGDYNEGFFNFK